MNCRKIATISQGVEGNRDAQAKTNEHSFSDNPLCYPPMHQIDRFRGRFLQHEGEFSIGNEEYADFSEPSCSPSGMDSDHPRWTQFAYHKASDIGEEGEDLEDAKSPDKISGRVLVCMLIEDIDHNVRREDNRLH
jgi:hypothetical protein